MSNKPISIPAVLLMAASGWMVPPAQAQQEQTPLPLPTFGEVDIDGNGFISTGESVVVPGLLEEMSSLDKDRDGKIDITEYAAFQPPQVDASGS
ncbi:MAG: EF-hand domain-containing protein [Gammaproteobacteria bacterium]